MPDPTPENTLHRDTVIASAQDTRVILVDTLEDTPMNLPKINITGNTEVDTITAELAVHLRDAGHTERDAVAEAQRIRDGFLEAAADVARRFDSDCQSCAVEFEVAGALRRLIGNNS